MTTLSLRGYEFEDVSVKDSFNRREIAFANSIIKSLKKIGVKEDQIEVSHETMLLSQTKAFVLWYHNGNHHYYSYYGKRFIDNLAIVSKVIGLSTLDVVNNVKTYEEFAQDFLEEPDVEEKRKEAREYFGLKEEFTMDFVNQTYKKLAKDLHPDMPTGDSEKFKKLNEAHKIIKREFA